MGGRRRRFALSDTVQQVVGGFLLAGPFVVTEEVWVLAAGMSVVQGVATVAIVLAIGYGALYKADDRNPDRETEVGGIPVRFISLIAVSYLSVLILALAFNAPETFVGPSGAASAGSLGVSVEWPAVGTTLKAVSIGSVFSVIGAATADSIY
ncbi:membrane protein [Halobellus salinus]|uniref:Membrane protein n=1 Tax=Halobellus salinus TaxID=931585 RepID=A0A830EQI7_9EURY|nr:DUF2391 family protein [Halobellus salinus]GGJ07206.1 membrane protein [Halobellus salinus]SMP25785.1 Putative integral membrane protein [Halobellus salinus]